MVKVTGDRVNRGAGYGLEIPCIYTLHGPTIYIEQFRHALSISYSMGPSVLSNILHELSVELLKIVHEGRRPML